MRANYVPLLTQVHHKAKEVTKSSMSNISEGVKILIRGRFNRYERDACEANFTYFAHTESFVQIELYLTYQTVVFFKFSNFQIIMDPLWQDQRSQNIGFRLISDRLFVQFCSSYRG